MSEYRSEAELARSNVVGVAITRRRLLGVTPLLFAATVAACSERSRPRARPAIIVSPSNSPAPRITWPPAPTPLQVSHIGDSVGYRGSFASTRALSWEGLLDAKLRTIGPIINARYADHVDAHGLTLVSSIADLTPGDGLTTVMFGDNDASEGHSPPVVAEEFGTLLDMVRQGSPRTTLLCSGLWAPSSVADRYDALIAPVAVSHDAVFVRVNDLYDDPANRLPVGVPSFGGHHTDGIHPNDTGHAAIYARFAAALGLV